MIVNNAKGWYGSLSKVGRDAAIHAFLKLTGYKETPTRKPIKKKVPKMDTDNLEYLKDNSIIILPYHNSIKTINKSNKQLTETDKNKEDKLQFHNFFHQQTEVEESRYANSPSCTKYTPKYSLVYPKLITGPKWKIISGRKYKKVEIDEKDFLITHESKIDSGYKYLVNMNKTTKRGDIFGNGDVRVRTDIRFDAILPSRNKKNKNKDKEKKNSFKNKILINNKDNKNKSNEKNMLNKQKSINPLNKKKTFSSSLDSKEEDKNNNKDEIYPKIKSNTIDFEKIISREKREKILSKKNFVDVIRKINYSSIEKRPKTVIFKKSKKHINFIQKFEGLEPNVNYDPNNSINIRQIYRLSTVPNFNLILQRPGNNKNPLPSFMQKIFNREGNYSITEKTLELNGYSKGKLGKVDSSFFPKQSFNNIVNMQIMSGKIFEDDYNIDDINNKKDRMKNHMKFKYKSLGKLIKEGALSKFDNVTFKTIHKTKNFLNSDLNKYLFGLKE